MQFHYHLQICVCYDNRLQCFKSAWMMAVLHDALGFPLNYHWLTSAETVKGRHVHWTLGALLYKTKYFPLRYYLYAVTLGNIFHQVEMLPGAIHSFILLRNMFFACVYFL